MLHDSGITLGRHLLRVKKTQNSGLQVSYVLTACTNATKPTFAHHMLQQGKYTNIRYHLLVRACVPVRGIVLLYFIQSYALTSMENLSSPHVPGFPAPCTNDLGADGAYTLNKKPLSQRCTTLDEVIQYLAYGTSATASPQHPDIRVQPTGEPIRPATPPDDAPAGFRERKASVYNGFTDSSTV